MGELLMVLKLEILEIGAFNFAMENGHYPEEYRGRIVTDGITYNYFETNGTSYWYVDPTLGNLLKMQCHKLEDNQSPDLKVDSALLNGLIGKYTVEQIQDLKERGLI